MVRSLIPQYERDLQQQPNRINSVVYQAVNQAMRYIDIRPMLDIRQDIHADIRYRLRRLGYTGVALTTALHLADTLFGKQERENSSFRNARSTSSTAVEAPPQQVSQSISPANKQVATRNKMDNTEGVKRMRIEDDDMGNAVALRTTGAGMANASGEKTQVEEYKFVKRGIDDYTTVLMPFREEASTFQFSAATEGDLTYRMTSVIDINNVSLSHNDPHSTYPGVTPWWRDHFMAPYKEYCVTKCYWKMSFEVYPMSATGTRMRDSLLEDLNVWYGYSGSTAVPPTVSNANMSLWPGWKCESIRTDPEKDNWGVISGVYRPGQFTREVADDAAVEIFTKKSMVPLLAENLTIRFRNSQDRLWNTQHGANTGILIIMRTSIDYTVQLKDLETAYKYPNSIA